MFQVRFIDYGNAEKCCFEDLRPADMFGNIRILTAKYSLMNTVPVSEDGHWPRKITDYFYNYLVGKKCHIITPKRSDTTDAIPCTITKTGDIIDIKSLLISNNFAKSV